MISRMAKSLFLAFPLALLLCAPAMANNCNNFAGYVCASGTGNNIHITGQLGTNSSIGTLGGLITGNSFTVSLVGGNSVSDVIVVAIFKGAVGGPLTGMNIT